MKMQSVFFDLLWISVEGMNDLIVFYHNLSYLSDLLWILI